MEDGIPFLLCLKLLAVSSPLCVCTCTHTLNLVILCSYCLAHYISSVIKYIAEAEYSDRWKRF